MIPYITPKNDYVIGPEGQQLRTLVAQVEKNKEDIANHYNVDRVLADFGIRVLGKLDSVADLEGKEGVEFGDAYLIGTEEPYSFYVWTRANVETGHPFNYWLDIGPIAIVGPEGPRGEKGDRGDPGKDAQWYTSSGDPNLDVIDPKILGGSMALAADGWVWIKLSSGIWERKYNITGPRGKIGPQGLQGIQGPRGDQGPQGAPGVAGGFFVVKGNLTNLDQLPNPAQAAPQDAYLYNDNMYIVINGIWTNIGDYHGSVITENGLIVGNFNADKKVSVINDSRVLYRGANNTSPIQAPVLQSTAAFEASGCVPVYHQTSTPMPTDLWATGTSVLYTGLPTKPAHAVNKKYVDELISKTAEPYTTKEVVGSEVVPTTDAWFSNTKIATNVRNVPFEVGYMPFRLRGLLYGKAFPQYTVEAGIKSDWLGLFDNMKPNVINEDNYTYTDAKGKYTIKGRIIKGPEVYYSGSRGFDLYSLSTGSADSNTDKFVFEASMRIKSPTYYNTDAYWFATLSVPGLGRTLYLNKSPNNNTIYMNIDNSATGGIVFGYTDEWINYRIEAYGGEITVFNNNKRMGALFVGRTSYIDNPKLRWTIRNYAIDQQYEFGCVFCAIISANDYPVGSYGYTLAERKLNGQISVPKKPAEDDDAVSYYYIKTLEQSIEFLEDRIYELEQKLKNK